MIARRAFITLLGGAAAAWPVAADAEDRTRRIGMLSIYAAHCAGSFFANGDALFRSSSPRLSARTVTIAPAMPRW